MVGAAVHRYGEEVASRLRTCFPHRLIGVWFLGSVALGDYVECRSDIDIVAVVEGAASQDERLEVVQALGDPSLLCPARKLEFVLYEQTAISTPRRDGAFALNFVTGPGMTAHVGTDPASEPGFWFVIDRAIAHDHAAPIVGTDAGKVFAPVPRRWALEALHDSLVWHRSHESIGYRSVLNAARTWRYAVDSTFVSKTEGGAWARDRWGEPYAIDAALALRRGEPAALAGEQIERLLDHVEAMLRPTE